MSELCSWCEALPWAFQCSLCDPRETKKLCANCAERWHSRGFSREHVLESRSGEKRSFLAWTAQRKAAASDASASSEDTSSHRATSNSDADHPGVWSSSAQPLTTSIPSETASTRPTDDDANEQSAASSDPSQAIPAQNTTPAVFTEPLYVEEVEENVLVGLAAPDSLEGKPDSVEENEGGAVSNSNEDTAVDVETSAPPTAEASTISSRTETQQRTARHEAEALSTTPSTGSTSSSSLHEFGSWVELDKLLRWFPTSDPSLQEMLGTRINAALKVEDALMCARYRKCTEPSCRSAKMHQEHCKKNQPCADPACVAAFKIYCHRRMCSGAAANSYGSKQSVCPFCIRVRQRRILGVIVALDHGISEQRRALRELAQSHSSHSEAKRNFSLQNISVCQQRKAKYLSEIEKLNRLASDKKVPMFNFPKYNWHFSDKSGLVAIKSETNAPEATAELPASISGSGEPARAAAEEGRGDVGSKAATAPSTPAEPSSSSHEASKVNHSSHLPDKAYTSRSETSESTMAADDDNSMSANSDFRVDFIDDLLRHKRAEGSETATKEFTQTMELGYSIVDASFCGPAKAQRCLLNCQAILVHLQHHLDLKVCKQDMCMAVEHHFSHLSKCKARKEDTSCEYCLRVQEREFARAVDTMEADQPEADARVQTIINAITSSFTDDPPEEREQAILQLEDELDQAEDNKRDLADKLNASRMKLRRVRKSMGRLGFPTASSQRLPLHFIKVRPGESADSGSHGNGFKKRRLLGSFD